MITKFLVVMKYIDTGATVYQALKAIGQAEVIEILKRYEVTVRGPDEAAIDAVMAPIRQMDGVVMVEVHDPDPSEEAYYE